LFYHFKFINNKISKLFNLKKSKYLTIIFIIFIIFLLSWNIIYTKIETLTKKNNSLKTNITEETKNNIEIINTEEEVVTDDSSTNISLIDYLSKLFCTGCSRHCPLSNPGCNKGEQQKEDKTEEYYQIYG